MPISTEDSRWVLDIILATMEGARQRRRFVEFEWLQNYRAYQGWPSYSYIFPLPDGAIHYFIPHARRTIERGSSRIKKLLLPRNKFFQTIPRDLFSYEAHMNAGAVDGLLDFIYSEKIDRNTVIGGLVRSLQLYDFSVLGTSVKVEKDEVWPSQTAKDPFSFYVFPDTAINRDEAQLIFEDIVIPYQVYYSFVDRDNPDTSLYEYIPVDKFKNPVWPYHLVERLAYRGLSSPSDFMQGTGNYTRRTEADLRDISTKVITSLTEQSRKFVQASKVYFRIQSTWYYCVVAYNLEEPCLLRLDEEENTPLYRWTVERPLPGELYVSSQMDDIRELQSLSNNALSQVESNRSVVAEPPVARDRNQATRTEQYVYKPRAIWDVEGDPNNIFKNIEVKDTGPEGIRAFQIYLGLMDRGNGGTIAEGQPGRNMPRAGFAVNNLVNLSLADTEDSATCIESGLLTPGMSDVYHVCIEYIPTSQILQIPGKAGQAPRAFNKLDLRGSYTFKWQCALEFRDTQQVADSLMKLFEILANPQTIQLLQMQGYSINFQELIQTLYVYSIGEEGLVDIITKAQPVQQGMQPGQMPMQGNPVQNGLQGPSGQQNGTQAAIPPQIQQMLQSLQTQGVPTNGTR